MYKEDSLYEDDILAKLDTIIELLELLVPNNKLNTNKMSVTYQDDPARFHKTVKDHMNNIQKTYGEPSIVDRLDSLETKMTMLTDMVAYPSIHENPHRDD